METIPTISEPGVLVTKSLIDKILANLDDLQTFRRSFDPKRTTSKGAAVVAAAVELDPWLITAATLIEARFWRYDGTLMLPMKSESSSRGYVEHPSNITTEHLYNEAEYGNGSIRKFQVDGVDAFGNGVIRSHVPTGFALKQIPVNRIVWARRVVVKDESNELIEYRFSEPNGITGQVECEPADLFAPSLFR